MIRYVLLRAGRSVLTVATIVVIVFVATRATGDPIDWLLPDDASLETKEKLRVALGLDEPMWVQFGHYISGLFQGDFGQSYQYLAPVGPLFADRAGATLALGAISLVISVGLAVPCGVLAAKFRNSIIDRVTITLSIIGHTVPNFVLGILAIFLFSLKLRWLPSGGTGSLEHYIMPVVCLSAAGMASIARLTRSSMLDELRSPYLDTARAKGAGEYGVVVRHALRNALIPVVTIVGLELGTILGGTVIVETVFAWPGIGSLVVNAAKVRDFPVIQFGVLIVAITIVICNLIVDLLYGVLDPRIRDSGRREL